MLPKESLIWFRFLSYAALYVLNYVYVTKIAYYYVNVIYKKSYNIIISLI